MTEANIEKLTRAIAEQEGFFVEGARPQRNHNPGDLRNWPGFPADDGGFSIFPDDETGWSKLTLDVTNHAAHYPNQDLFHFVAGGNPPEWGGYAPASDSNDSAGYARALAQALGVETTTTFAQL